MNGAAITATGHTGPCRGAAPIMPAPPGARSQDTESSGTAGRARRLPAGRGTTCRSTGVDGYATNIRTEATGAKQLNLPLATQGAQPIDLIRRPVVNSNEDTAESARSTASGTSRQASLRILLSDRAADITNLPTVTPAAPVDRRTWRRRKLRRGGRPDAIGTPQGENRRAGVTVSATSRASPGCRQRRAATLTTQTAATTAVSVTTARADLDEVVLDPHRAGTQPTPSPGGHQLPGMNARITGCIVCGAHAIVAINGQVRITGGSTVPGSAGNVTAAPRHTATSTTIGINGMPNNSLVNQFVATRTFFVGEDPVTCTGFAATTRPAAPASRAAATLTSTIPSTRVRRCRRTMRPSCTAYIKIERRPPPTPGPTSPWSCSTSASPAQPGRRHLRRPDARRDRSGCSACATIGLRRPARSRPTQIDSHDYWPLTLYDAREGSTRNLRRPTTA